MAYAFRLKAKTLRHSHAFPLPALTSKLADAKNIPWRCYGGSALLESCDSTAVDIDGDSIAWKDTGDSAFKGNGADDTDSTKSRSDKLMSSLYDELRAKAIAGGHDGKGYGLFEGQVDNLSTKDSGKSDEWQKIVSNARTLALKNKLKAAAAGDSRLFLPSIMEVEDRQEFSDLDLSEAEGEPCVSRPANSTTNSSVRVLNSQAYFSSQAEAPAMLADGLEWQMKHSNHPGQQIWGNSHCCRLHRPIFTKLGDHTTSFTGPQYRQGNSLQHNGSVLGSQPSTGTGTGTFFCLTNGFATTRGLATAGDVGDEDADDINVSDTSMSEGDDSSDVTSSGILSSDDERGDDKVKGKKQTSMRSANTQQGDEDDDDYTDGDDFCDEIRARNPLDLAANSLEEATGDHKLPLWKRLEGAPGEKKTILRDVLDEWTSEGHPLTKAVLINTITILRKRRKFWRSLEVSDWVMSEKPYELEDMDYGIRVQLISKVQGPQKAATYFATIPKQFQTSMVYSILLTAYVEHNKEKEALNLLKKAEELGLDHMTYMHNQLLYLYKKNGLMAGVAQVLQTMDEKNIEPDVYTYNCILDIRARKGDVDGMEKVWARVKVDQTVKPDATTFAILAKGYMLTGLQEKAEEVVKQIEESRFRRKRIVNLVLLKLYGVIGKEEELERIWGLASQEQKLGIGDYLAMIKSLGKVGNSARAEDIFEEMQDNVKDLSVHHYNALLSVYARLGRTQKGESLLKQIARARLNPNPGTYHELVQMYLKAGHEAKAMEVLSKAQKASQSSIRKRPMYATFQVALEWFAEKGDVKNAEKAIRDLKLAGYVCSFRSYVVLLKAYEKGRRSPYGILDRLRADNLVPNQLIRKELKKLDGT